MALPSWNCQRPSSDCRPPCSSSPAATGRWWRSWHWCCTTTSRPCSPQWSWPWSLGAASKTHILNVLHRLLDGKPAPAPVTSPQALKLAVEPQANVLRYDQLREVRYAS
jgi:hypothetical protein